MVVVEEGGIRKVQNRQEVDELVEWYGREDP